MQGEQELYHNYSTCNDMLPDTSLYIAYGSSPCQKERKTMVLMEKNFMTGLYLERSSRVEV